MALQDLTPQLRTRLSRMERAVGTFVLLALSLLTFGFVYYIYTTAETKGWFKIKAPYFMFADRATGLKVGDPVQMMGFDVGQITEITAMAADNFAYNVYIQFELKEPFYDYIWTEGSLAKVNTADLLGKRVLEVTRGTGGYPAYAFFELRLDIPTAEAAIFPDANRWLLAQEVFDQSGTNRVCRAWTGLTNLPIIEAAGCTNLILMNTAERRKFITGVWDEEEARYLPYHTKKTKLYGQSKPYWLNAQESAAVTERLEKIVGNIEVALPRVLSLTNQLKAVLSNGVNLTSNLNVVAFSARPVVSNLAAVTANLDRPGALGDWLLPTNINHQLGTTLSQAELLLGNANSTITAVDTNISVLAFQLSQSLANLADLTSNLNQQVQVNTNLLSEISETVVHADQFVQGLKKHWFLRSAFKTKATNAPPNSSRSPAPKAAGQR